ncbi:putative dehydrogenase [Arthrobacter silviterrae]|uniref:Gfo/Idh/MocA family oxidoreductase n=1 Tax=Arthrobacter silviterrae TaxID=2026658 RepID=A0ABX0DCL4_9MICC|nr:Gfo/Idh/MocA family oxidoreductase [Arthrobacter silviterrae]MDQ0278599.1 putative dehydrogenase [Arthrobacter silviterrae]NGN82145.1 Gfo/Idh/MocA family oxidoreductase [Arthrobacter silviterrae]
MTAPIRPGRLRVAVLSFAHTHAASYIRHLAGRADVELLTADPDSAQSPEGELRGAAFAAAHGAAYADSYQEVLDWRPDAVVICSENSKHAGLVQQFAAAGAHVLCEKPLATSVADAELALEAAAAAGVRLMTAFPVRFSPAYQELRGMVRAGELGDIVSVVGTNNGWMPSDRAWFTDPELAGGGALVDHVVHCADLLDDLLGVPAQRIHAVSNRILHAQRGVTVETGGLVTITYQGGVIATIDCSWSQPASAPTWGGLTFTVTGTKGSVRIDPFASHVGGFDALGAAWLPYGADLDSLMIDEFISAIQAGRQPQPDGGSGLRTLEIVKAAQASVASGQPVHC